ncbi:hypothetical protein DPMN_049742 [Dreissena polymorpha]|uniref:Uncharacterized protein n=1 Tax=Dreissena polymorpha TaxID=45954 RepID=A0A9D4CFV9_DREPO|nr:hypothetical protein DPMN_049742 [Dreissena polymorpha]
MSLPFVPVEEIEPVLHSCFGSLTDERLLQLRKYIFDQWVNSTTFQPVTWNGFRRDTRTNNDCEGWHRRMNSHARETTPPFYELIPFLNADANKFTLTRVMVAEGSMYRREKLKFKQKNEWYLRLWDLYNEGEMSTAELLSDVSSTVGPIQ